MTSDPWDLLSDIFSGRSSNHELQAVAADNVLIAWPPMLEFLDQREPHRVLDFGCGGGRLVEELHRCGYEAVGVDRSPKMIESARSALGGRATLEVGDVAKVLELAPFDAVISVMVLQFVENVMGTLTAITSSLARDGALIFAVHNPMFVEQFIANGTIPPYEVTTHGRRTTLALRKDAPVSVYVRTTEEYDDMLDRCGFVRTLHCEPPFTQEFVDQYKFGTVDESEFLILGYEKQQ